MTIFTAAERDYLRSQHLARLATVQPNGTVQNNPVTFRVNADDSIDIFGMHMASSRKYRNVAGHPQVALVVDDLASVDPWQPRCLEIRGVGEQVPDAGAAPFAGGDGAALRVHPRQLISFAINSGETVPGNRRVGD